MANLIDLKQYEVRDRHSRVTLDCRSFKHFVDGNLGSLPDGVSATCIKSGGSAWIRDPDWLGVQITGGTWKQTQLRRKVMIKDGKIDLSIIKAKIKECAEHAAKEYEQEARANERQAAKDAAQADVQAKINAVTDRVSISSFSAPDHMSIRVDIKSPDELEAVLDALAAVRA